MKTHKHTTSAPAFIRAVSATLVAFLKNACNALNASPRLAAHASVLCLLAAVFCLQASATTIVKVSVGNQHSLYLTNDGKLYGMGANNYGQLGVSGTDDRLTPVLIDSGVADMSAGSFFTLYVKGDGTLWATGNNANGQLGLGDTNIRTAPVQVPVPGGATVATVSAGQWHTFFVTRAGVLYGMGANNYGQLGDYSSTEQHSPELIDGSGIVALAVAGYQHSMYLLTNGNLLAMGWNANYELGTGDTTNRASPILVGGKVTVMAAGGGHSLFIGSVTPTGAGGYFQGMGAGSYGQLVPVKK